jgi:hypothetical protein
MTTVVTQAEFTSTQRNSILVSQDLSTGGTQVISKRALLASLLSMSALLFAPGMGYAETQQPVVVMVDHTPTGFVYDVDSKLAKQGLLWTLSNTKRENSNSVLLVSEDASISMVNNVRGIMAKAGYANPQTFYFGRDKKWMAELNFSNVVPFSAQGQTAPQSGR